MKITKVSVVDGCAFIQVSGVDMPIVVPDGHAVFLTERQDGQFMVESLSIENQSGGHIIAESRTPLK